MAFPYTPEFLASLRQRYEETDEPVTSIAADFDIHEATVYRIVQRENWKARARLRALPRHLQLFDAVRAEAERPIPTAPECSPVRPRPRFQPSAGPGINSNGDPETEPGFLDSSPGLTRGLRGNERSGESDPSPLDRLEQLVLKEIESEENRRGALGSSTRPRAESAHTARALSTLAQTLQAIERLRRGEEIPVPGHFDDSSDPIPKDADEFRNELARRIDAFVAGRTDARHAEGSGGPEVVDEAR